MASNRNFLRIIIALTLLFGFISFTVTYKIYQDQYSNPNTSTNVISKSYISIIEKELEIENLKQFETTEAMVDEIAKGNQYLLIEPVKYQNYIQPCFKFLIYSNCVEITSGTAKEYYDYSWTSNKIVKIGDKNVSELSYFDTYLALISEKEATVTFTMEDSSTVDYSYKNNYTDTYVKTVTDDTITLKIYNLEKVNRKVIYSLTKDYEHVVLDLKDCYVGTKESMTDFISLFSPAKQVLFKDDTTKAFTTYKLDNKDVRILIENGSNTVDFMAYEINGLNQKVSFDVAPTTSKVTYDYVVTNSIFNVHFYTKELTALGLE